MTTHVKDISSSKSKSGRNWGLFFWGVVVALSGLVFLFWPGLTLIAISQIAGVLLIIAGVFDFYTYWQDRKVGAQSGWAIVNGACCLILGILFLIHPIVASTVIPFIVGVFVLLYSIISIVSAVSMRSVIPVWGFMLANGVVALLCGILFIVFPASFAIYLGAFMIMRGITMCAFGATSTQLPQYF